MLMAWGGADTDWKLLSEITYTVQESYSVKHRHCWATWLAAVIAFDAAILRTEAHLGFVIFQHLAGHDVALKLLSLVWSWKFPKYITSNTLRCLDNTTIQCHLLPLPHTFPIGFSEKLNEFMIIFSSVLKIPCHKMTKFIIVYISNLYM